MNTIMLARARGFSLIDIMLGLAIGMIGMLVMMQVYLNSQASQHTTGETGDAQINGSMALMSLQRQIRQAGFGVTDLSLRGCSIVLRNGVTLTGLAPLTINHAAIPAGDPGSDTLLILMGSDGGSSQGNVIVQQPVNTRYLVATPSAFQTGDWLIVAPPVRQSPCDLILDAVVTLDTTTAAITVGIGTAGAAGAAIFNLGSSPSLLAYAVRHGQLTVCNYLLAECADTTQLDDATVWQAMAVNIVALRAQYGRDTSVGSMRGQFSVWDQITPGSVADTSGLHIECSSARILAARIALVARSGQLEKAVVTSQAPVWEGSADVPIDLQQTSDWDHYRYRVFQSLIPLRNALMPDAQSGC